jgi:hypothetical protein
MPVPPLMHKAVVQPPPVSSIQSADGRFVVLHAYSGHMGEGAIQTWGGPATLYGAQSAMYMQQKEAEDGAVVSINQSMPASGETMLVPQGNSVQAASRSGNGDASWMFIASAQSGLFYWVDASTWQYVAVAEPLQAGAQLLLLSFDQLPQAHNYLWRIADYASGQPIVANYYFETGLCFPDDASRALGMNGSSPDATGVVPSQCAKVCASKGATGFAMQDGGQCFCQAPGQDAGALLSSPLKPSPQSCAATGAGWVNSYYAFGQSPAPAKYLGCFADDAKRTVGMTGGGQPDGEDMSVSECSAFCQGRGAAGYAVQDGNQCFCVDGVQMKTGAYAQLGNSSNCSGAPAVGGGWANAVYKFVH